MLNSQEEEKRRASLPSSFPRKDKKTDTAVIKKYFGDLPGGLVVKTLHFQ